MKTNLKIVAVSALILFTGIFSYIYVGSITFSDGERTGVVTKFSHKGIMFKTYEGELSQGSVDQGGMRTTWLFSVADPKIIEEVKNCLRDGRKCTLHYKQQLLQQSWKGSTSYFIVEVVKQ